jgi:NADH:ubiquinone oxidoreductase subunit 6 (subunit J)
VAPNDDLRRSWEDAATTVCERPVLAWAALVLSALMTSLSAFWLSLQRDLFGQVIWTVVFVAGLAVTLVRAAMLASRRKRNPPWWFRLLWVVKPGKKGSAGDEPALEEKSRE